jgi:hypothetical protein
VGPELGKGHGPFLRRRIRSDPAVRAELKAALKAGTPRSHYLGREPREWTTYEYDDRDRLIRSVTQREPLWTGEDRAWFEAYLAEVDEVCGGCGNPLDECRDPKTAGKWQIVESQCEACRIAEADADNRAEAAQQTKGAKRRGLFHGVVKRG